MPMNSLDPPETISGTSDPAAREVLRLWIADGELHLSMLVNTDPLAWGRLLADVISHAANAIELHEGPPAAQAEKAIVNEITRITAAPPAGPLEGRSRPSGSPGSE